MILDNTNRDNMLLLGLNCGLIRKHNHLIGYKLKMGYVMDIL